MILITASVKVSQPLFWWEPAWCALTVSVALSNSTPCSAQRSRLPDVGTGLPKSLFISLKMFCNEGGWSMPSGTEKQSPCACPGPWYGSCPRMTTLVCSAGQWSKALKMSFPGGYIFVVLYSFSRIGSTPRNRVSQTHLLRVLSKRARFLRQP